MNPPPFGMQIENRAYTNGDKGYRFGFNGMERDDEVKGDGNSLDFGARIYDSRIGRWLSQDFFSKLYPAYSPYSFALNLPILFIDPSGNVVRVNGGSSGNPKQIKTIIEDALANKVVVTVNGPHNILKVAIKDGEKLTDTEMATFKLLEKLTSEEKNQNGSYKVDMTIVVNETNQKGWGAQDDYDDATIFINGMAEVPRYGPLNKNWVLYHFFYEQELKNDPKSLLNPNRSQQYADDCRNTIIQQETVFGFVLGEGNVSLDGLMWTFNLTDKKSGEYLTTLKIEGGVWSYENKNEKSKSTPSDKCPDEPSSEPNGSSPGKSNTSGDKNTSDRDRQRSEDDDY